MIPFELERKAILISKTNDFRIVVLSADSPSCERNALKMREAFGNDVVAWIQIIEDKNPKPTISPHSSRSKIQKSRIASLVDRLKCEKWDIFSTFSRAVQRKQTARKYSKKFTISESKFHDEEIARLRKKFPNFSSTKISIAQVTDGTLESLLKKANPYILATLSGPIYKENILNLARGFAINQHAGHSPEYRGSQTVYQALYHRDLQKVSATVHFTTSDVDAGPILRRSHPLLHPEDSAEMIFWRTVILGTELMINAISEIQHSSEISVYVQPMGVGRNYRSSDLDHHKVFRMKRDFVEGWLAHQLQDQYSF